MLRESFQAYPTSLVKGARTPRVGGVEAGSVVLHQQSQHSGMPKRGSDKRGRFAVGVSRIHFEAAERESKVQRGVRVVRVRALYPITEYKS